MITFDEAEKIVMQTARQLTTEWVSLENSMGRILAEDVFSDIDMPPFDKSAMDGFACRREDLASEIEVVETIQAGYAPVKSIGPNQCAKIMTGAPVAVSVRKNVRPAWSPISIRASERERRSISTSPRPFQTNP